MNRLKGEGRLKSSLSIFNIGLYIFLTLCPIFLWGSWDLNMLQGIFFCFGTFVLLGLSFLCPVQRDYTNRFLGIFILYSLINVFIHTFSYGLTNTYAKSFLNYCLMSEGFIYILCACILFYLIVRYSNNFKIHYPILFITILNVIFCFIQRSPYELIWRDNDTRFGMMGTKSNLAVFSALSIPILWHYKKYLIILPLICLALANSYSAILALSITCIVYALIKKRFLITCLIVVIFIGIIFLNLNALSVKFATRTAILRQIVIPEIITHPFIGWGFDNSINSNKVFSPHTVENAFVYRNNDYLNIARDLGLPFLTILCLFLFRIFKKAKRDYLFLSSLILAIACAMQTSMYFPRIAIMGIFLMALMEANYGLS